MRHILSVLVENKSGVLSRVTGMISRRGFNIDSLTVAPTEDETLVLFKVLATPERRHEVIEIADLFRAKVVDVGKNTLTVEATGASSKLDALEDLFRGYGIKQLTRTGKIAMSRGSHDN